MGTDATMLDPADAPPRPRAGGRCPCCGAAVPSPRGDRRFTLSDAMILVAASAVAFVIVRPVIASGLHHLPRWAKDLAAFVAGLVAWTPAVLALRLRRPRPRLWHLARQPGFAAGLVGTSVLGLAAVSIGLLALVRAARRGLAVRAGLPPTPPDPAWWVGVLIQFGQVLGLAVIGAWLLLAVGGRRRPTRGWLDGLGRAIGAAWIVLFVVSMVARLASFKD